MSEPSNTSQLNKSKNCEGFVLDMQISLTERENSKILQQFSSFLHATRLSFFNERTITTTVASAATEPWGVNEGTSLLFRFLHGSGGKSANKSIMRGWNLGCLSTYSTSRSKSIKFSNYRRLLDSLASILTDPTLVSDQKSKPYSYNSKLLRSIFLTADDSLCWGRCSRGGNRFEFPVLLGVRSYNK